MQDRCPESMAPTNPQEMAAMHHGVIPYTQGVDAHERAAVPGYDTGVVALLLGLFLIISFNFTHYTTFLKTFAQDLWQVRRRDNLFDDTSTLSEARIRLSLTLLVCVCEGIIARCALPSPAMAVFPGIVLLSALALVYYIWQQGVYRLVGYTFTDAATAQQWIRGFGASQWLLGLALAVPAVLILFNPGSAEAVVPIAVVLYIMARLIFIVKGFRLFYDKISSLCYFILYLCTLEIVPVVVVLRVVRLAI